VPFVDGTILRCNTRLELTVAEFLHLDRMPGAKRPVPARVHCELQRQHDGDHVAFGQNAEGRYASFSEWWVRWNDGSREITEIPWCMTKDPDWPEDQDEDDPMLCGLPKDHQGAHDWEMRSDLQYTRTANGVGELERDRLRAVPADDRVKLRISFHPVVVAMRWPDWDHWLLMWPPEEYPDYESRPSQPEWRPDMTDADFDDTEGWIDPAFQFTRDLPLITGQARDRLRRAEESVRRALADAAKDLDAIDTHPWRR
jgi:hypothetical protein